MEVTVHENQDVCIDQATAEVSEQRVHLLFLLNAAKAQANHFGGLARLRTRSRGYPYETQLRNIAATVAALNVHLDMLGMDRDLVEEGYEPTIADYSQRWQQSQDQRQYVQAAVNSGQR